MTDPILVPANLPPVMTVAQVAEFLNLDRTTVYTMLERGELEGSGRRGKGTAIRIWTASAIAWVRGERMARIAPGPPARLDPARGRRRSA